MAEPVDVVVEARQRSANWCSSTGAAQLCSNDQVLFEARQLICKGRTKSVLLLIGFTCIVCCFVLASMGYIELKSCPASSQDPGSKSCKQDSYQFKKSHNYRLSAAVLFVFGVCIIATFIWLVKQGSRGQQYMLRTDVVVSDVTEEGFQKTPAPDLSYPHSQLHRMVYGEITEMRSSLNGLPHYESALKLNKQAKEDRIGVTSSTKKIFSKGAPKESVSVQVDEDEIDPPPSYSQALLHQSDTQQENLYEQNQDELANS